jgi:hypothetical protein
MSAIVRMLAVSTIAASLCVAPIHAHAEDGGCQLTKVASLPITVTPQNELLVDGKIAGQPVQFRIDTGSQRTIMDFSVRKRFGISVIDSNQREVTVGGHVHFLEGTIPGFSLGNFPGGNVSLPVSSKHFLADDVAGIVGQDMFGKFDVDFDLAAQKIVWFNHNACPGEPIYWSRSFSEADVDTRRDQVIVTIMVNGTPARALLDTGLPVTTISWSLAHRLGVEESTQGVAAAGQMTGPDRHPIDLHQYRFAEFKFGDEAVHNPVLYIAKLFQNQFEISTGIDATYGVVDIDAVIGADFVKSHHMYLETAKGKLYFTYNGGSVFSRPPTVVPPAK